MAPKWEVNGAAPAAWQVRESNARREGWRLGFVVGLSLGVFVVLTLFLAACASPTTPRPVNCQIVDTVTFLDATTHQPSTVIVSGHIAGCTSH